MTHDSEKLKRIYDRTQGYCHICHKKLSFSNYGSRGTRGSWHIEHSVPKAKGGTDHLNNLFAACIDCNLDKGTYTTQTARRRAGQTRAPLSKKKVAEIRTNRTVGGLLTGAVTGLIIGGPVGMFIGGAGGAIIGNTNSPKK
jgi:5-methylcytosine-specific restriction endonuclease McrA